MLEIEQHTKTMLAMGAVGGVIGVGQMLVGRETITARVAIGRSVVSGGLGLCAGAALAVFPELPMPALVGIASVLVSLGTSSLERLLQRLFPSVGAE